MNITEFDKNLTLDSRSKNHVELDSVILLKRSSFTDQCAYSIDHETEQEFSSIVYSNTDGVLYKQKLCCFGNILPYPHPQISYMLVMDIMHKLSERYSDIYTHYFLSAFIPFMEISKHSSLADAPQKVIMLFNKAQIKIIRISNYLYAKKIAQNNT